MSKKSLPTLLKASAILLGIFVLGALSLSPAAFATDEDPMGCEGRLPAPAAKWFRKEPLMDPFLIGELKKDQPLAKTAAELYRTLSRANRNSAKRPWVSGFQVVAALPKNTEQAPYFGYNLMHALLKSAGAKPPATGVVYVSTKLTSIDEVVSGVIEDAGIGPRSVKTRERVEALIERLAALIGPPSERLILSSRYSERTGSFADLMGAGLVVNSIAIINKQTGMTVDIDNLDRTDDFRVPF